MQVALRMKSRGGTARGGDVIPYIFCVGETGETSKTAQADRAKHPDEVRKVGSELKIGRYLLHTEVHALRAYLQTMNIISLSKFSHLLNDCATQLRAQIGHVLQNA